MCGVGHNPRDVFDITSSYFAGNYYTAGSPKCSSYVAKNTCKRQNKFTNAFYRFNFNLFVLVAGQNIQGIGIPSNLKGRTFFLSIKLFEMGGGGGGFKTVTSRKVV